MKQRTRRRQLEQSQRSWVALPHGPFGPVKVHAPTAEQLAYVDVRTSRAARADYEPERDHSGRTTDRSMTMTAFFEYLHDHEATTELAKALADVAMHRTCSARPVPSRSSHERFAS
jgi:hypothetical protein